MHSPHSLHFIRSSGTPQRRIRGQSRHHMTGKIYFRNYSNKTFFCIIDNIPNLILCIISPIRSIIILIKIFLNHRMLANTADFGQLGILLNFYTPALIIGKMPMKHIQLMHGQQIYISFYFIHREKMACYIKMHSPVRKTRGIIDMSTRNFPLLYRNTLFISIHSYVKQLF